MNTSLRCLNIGFNLLGDGRGRGNDENAVLKFAMALGLNKTLTFLSLAGNWMYNFHGHQGAQALTEALRKNTTLTELDLQSTYMDNEVLTLIEPLRANTTLVRLDLRYMNTSTDELEIQRVFLSNPQLVGRVLRSVR